MGMQNEDNFATKIFGLGRKLEKRKTIFVQRKYWVCWRRTSEREEKGGKSDRKESVADEGKQMTNQAKKGKIELLSHWIEGDIWKLWLLPLSSKTLLYDFTIKNGNPNQR